MVGLTVVVVCAAGAGGYRIVYHLMQTVAGASRPAQTVNIADVVKLTIAILTLFGAVLAGVYAYRKQRIAEGDAHRADAIHFAERFTTAAGQLGHETAAVRLAGVYAMARLADDWDEQRQVCIDVLCACLRMPYEPDPESDSHRKGEREVRHTIIRVIRDHLDGSREWTSWSACSFDFTRANFDGGDLSGSHFSGRVSFADAEFIGDAVSFTGARFNGGGVTFNRAQFSDGTVAFCRAQFSDGTVAFRRAQFSGGTVSFDHAKFSGGTVTLDDAQFTGGTVTFYNAQFTDGAVSFSYAQFISSTVTFHHAKFSGGTVALDHAAFISSTVAFVRARLRGGTVTFDGARFTGADVRWGPLRPPEERPT